MHVGVDDAEIDRHFEFTESVQTAIPVKTASKNFVETRIYRIDVSGKVLLMVQ